MMMMMMTSGDVHDDGGDVHLDVGGGGGGGGDYDEKVKIELTKNTNERLEGV
jgi:hypothetical protein